MSLPIAKHSSAYHIQCTNQIVDLLDTFSAEAILTGLADAIELRWPQPDEPASLEHTKKAVNAILRANEVVKLLE